MDLPALLRSLTDGERDFMDGLDYGDAQETHRAGLDAVIENGGVVDFDSLGYCPPWR